MSKEILTDGLLKEAVSRAFEMESSVYERMAEKAGEHEFSPEYRQRMEELAATPKGGSAKSERKGFGRKRKWLRIAAAAVIFIAVSGTAVSAIDPLHEKMYEVLEFTLPDHTDISFKELADDELSKGEAITPETFQVRRLNALPEYKKDYVHTDCDAFLDYVEGYMDEEGWTMFYEQMDMKMALDTSFSVTSNGEKAKTIYIDGKKAYLITDDDEYRHILYVRDGYLYSIAGHGDADKLAGMLESVFAQEPAAEPDWWKEPSEEMLERYTPKELKNIPDYYKPWWMEERIDYFETKHAYISDKSNGRDGVYELHFTQRPAEDYIRTEIAGHSTGGILVGGEQAYLLPGEDGRRKLVLIKDGMMYSLESDEEPEVLAEILEATVCD